MKVAGIISRRLGISRSRDKELRKSIREYNLKGISALREAYNVECFEDITPSLCILKIDKCKSDGESK